MGPAELGALLSRLEDGTPASDGLPRWDDAAVLRRGPSSVLLYTVDFFTPLVDDASDWGAIAAAHALSDIYAMGGEPRVALSVAAWTRDRLPLSMLHEALGAAQDKLTEAGATLAGGHTIWDSCPKLGFTVLGDVDERSIMCKSAGRAGDVLILTKPLGTGVVCTGLKARAVPDETIRSTVDVMTTLNAGAARAAVEAQVRCATDVTGFGLAGHLRDLALASGMAATLHLDAVPMIDGALELALRFRTSNAEANRRHADPRLSPAIDEHDPRLELLFDPQSSGGLLLACRPERVDALCARLRSGCADAAVIGTLSASAPAGEISLEP
jgi:selenide,water dikinase